MQISYSAISKPLEDLFYALEPLFMGILLTNMLQFTYTKAKTRSGTHWQKWGPVYYVAIANVLSMMMPLAVLFIYIGKVNYPASKMWKDGSWFPNTPHGILFFIAKWVGTGLLMVGIVQITNLHQKIQQRWRELRGGKTEVTGPVEVTISSPPASCKTSS